MRQLINLELKHLLRQPEIVRPQGFEQRRSAAIIFPPMHMDSKIAAANPNAIRIKTEF